ncbi:MAG: hypothetical protein CVU64_17980 [Deltaproteobacteria bacterium HGW-Deltaproteobacteria-21]|nr:MAG: hypothetical protein CVU64_17980 [Deltaproteobacteria bacterium HGW-Deltaproteobacteria-21]
MSLIKYIYSELLIRVFTFSSKNRLPWLAALLFPAYMRRIKKAGKGGKPVRLLIIAKEGFNEDILASLGRDNRFVVFELYRKVVKALAAGLLDPSLEDNNYVSKEIDVEASKEAYRSFMKEFWQKLQLLYGFDAVLSGNFAYYADHEFAAALEELGVPFIVLQKENLKTPGFMGFFSYLYRERRGPFLGRKILVYNDIERRLEIDSGVVSEEHVSVVGMPRLDRLHRMRQNGPPGEARRPAVLFFSFGPKTGLPLLARKAGSGILGNHERLSSDWEMLNWERLCRECHMAMIRLARENPGIDVFIKSKMRDREKSAMHEMLGRDERLTPNVKIVIGGDPFQLIESSDVVCGFNTTALFEALAAGRPVVVPLFEEALESTMTPYIVDMGEAVDYASSPNELIRLLVSHAQTPRKIATTLSDQKKKVLEKWVGNIDGRSGERVRDAVIRIIHQAESVKAAL